MIRQHKRTKIVQDAEIEATMALHAIAKDRDLSYAEEIVILTNRIQSLTEYMIRMERHPDDPAKRGDEE